VEANLSLTDDAPNSGKKKKKPRINGGKYGFDDYINSSTTVHEDIGVKVGDRCHCCGVGKYYPGKDRKQIEFSGGPIITAKRHIKKTLRCNCCGDMKMAIKRIVRWSPEARSALVIHKIYGNPWNRMERIQKLFGTPLAASTMYDQGKIIWEEAAQFIVPVLFNTVAESPLWQTDDTGMKILSVMQANKLLPESEQRACHTTVICGLFEEFKVVLYITANRYCRENWGPLLERRKSDSKVIIATDASSQSLPKGDELKRAIPAVCLGGHGRRKFKDIEKDYPEECDYFLKLISDLYQKEHACKGKSDLERLEYHKKHSTPIIKAIYAKIAELFKNKTVEPNSTLGKAMQYWLNHKEGLTAFLRVAGAPIDNNWAERALRIMAIYRKTSLFFKTMHSALVMNDLFTLVATCEENGINAFMYLNWIQVNWKQVQATPHLFLPWHFKNETEAIAA
jgi:transposase